MSGIPITVGDVAQWLTLLAGVWLFFRKQAQTDAIRITKWDDFQKGVISRIESLESLVYSRDQAGFVTRCSLSQDLSVCGEKHSADLLNHKTDTDRRVGQLEKLFEDVSKKLTEMDQVRERTRESDQQKLARIEISIERLAADVGHLASDMQTISQLGKTLETIASRLEGGV
jgi:DNA-binding HxlR family transcriptional regulator